MKKFDTSDMSYDEYKDIQVERSNLKWHTACFWKTRFIGFQRLMKEVLELSPKPKSICCMGIRDGCEWKAFREMNEYAGCNIHGVDINPQVKEVGENCYCYDFNNLPKEWEDKFDLIYTNSIDHAYEIEKTLKEWYRVSKGYIVVTFSGGIVSASDIYTIDRKEDLDKVIDKDLFEIVKAWDNDGINVLLKVKK